VFHSESADMVSWELLHYWHLITRGTTYLERDLALKLLHLLVIQDISSSISVFDSLFLVDDFALGKIWWWCGLGFWRSGHPSRCWMLVHDFFRRGLGNCIPWDWPLCRVS
jgi:hypothetical protein